MLMKSEHEHACWEYSLRNIDFSRLSRDITEVDEDIYSKITAVDLSETEKDIIITPARVYNNTESVLAIHWHPEHIPLELISQRIDNTFPDKTNELIIPTQHNIFMSYGEYSGVEIDCFSREFSTKVQLLVHIKNSNLENAHRLKSMVRHTFKYRSEQLYQFIDAIVNPRREELLKKAVNDTLVNQELVTLVRIYTEKLKNLIIKNESSTSSLMLKNKLVRDFFDELCVYYGSALIDKIQVFLNDVKKYVKKSFSPEFFYDTQEMIEEVRKNKGCIIVPHPEQFWPILLADYDLDGFEIWNPQSQKYSEFMIGVIDRLNKNSRDRRLLITMGDDTHMGEKLKDPSRRDMGKYGREIGVQPGWNDLSIRKSLLRYNISMKTIIDEYKARLGS